MTPHTRGIPGYLVSIVVTALITSFLVACGSAPARPELDDAALKQQRRAFVEENNAAYAADLDKVLARMELEFARAEDPTAVSYDMLIVHGGGPSGAFATGFLLGWGDVTHPQMSRPAFDMVNGSSAGALLAPFAYVGTDDAYDALREMTLEPPFEFRDPSTRSLWPGRPGMLDTDSLKAGLGVVLDAKTVAAIRAQSDEQRSLMISGTNIDLGLGRFWDVGRQIEHLEVDAARDRLKMIIMASAAVPVLFPPVEIDGSLYSDGGVSANIFVSFDKAGLLSIAEKWYERHPDDPMPLIRIWVLMSRELFLAPQIVQPRYPDIGLRSLNIMMKYDRLKSLVGLAYMLEDLDEHRGIRTELRYAMPPPDADLPEEMSAINDPEVARRMLELGYSLGARVDSWMQEMPDTYTLQQE